MKNFTVFYSQTNDQIKSQNSIIKIYLYFFIKFKQNNWIFKIQTSAIHLFSRTVDNILVFFIKEPLIDVQNQELQEYFFETSKIDEHLPIERLLYIKALEKNP